MNPLVSIIILNYNGKSLLQTFLPFICELEYPNYEIIVVDNASYDDSINFLEREFPDIKIVKNGKNLGYGGGNHQGVLNAKGEFFWFLNTDIEVKNDSLSELITFMKNKNDVGISCPAIYYYHDRNKLQCAGINFNKFGYLRGVQKLDCNKLPFEVSYASGAALLIRKNVYFEIGGFDEDIFMYGDDIDLSFRCWLKGYKVFAVPLSIAYHKHYATTSKESMEWLILNTTKSMLQTLGKNLQIRTLLICYPSFLAITFIYFTIKLRYIFTIIPMFYAIVIYLKEIKTTFKKRVLIQKNRIISDDIILK